MKVCEKSELRFGVVRAFTGDVACYQTILGNIVLLPIILPNIDQFSNFFHHRTDHNCTKFAKKASVKTPIIPTSVLQHVK